MRVTAEAFEAMVREHIPMSQMLDFAVERMEAGEAEVRLRFGPLLSRPGGIISGPSMMILADTALFAAVVSEVGLGVKVATTSLNFSFLKGAPQVDLLGKARLIKRGRRSAYGEIVITSGEDPEPVCHATGSYAIWS